MYTRSVTEPVCDLHTYTHSQVMPDALVLHFATADLHEAAGDVTAAKAVYEKLAAPLEAEDPPSTPDVKDGKDKPAAAAQVCNWCSGGEGSHPGGCRMYS